MGKRSQTVKNIRNALPFPTLKFCSMDKIYLAIVSDTILKHFIFFTLLGQNLFYAVGTSYFSLITNTAWNKVYHFENGNSSSEL